MKSFTNGWDWLLEDAILAEWFTERCYCVSECLVNSSTRTSGPPVFYAISECNLEALQVLHAAGHDQGVQNSDGQSLTELLTEIFRAAEAQSNA